MKKSVEWISVKERLPEIDVQVLVADENYPIVYYIATRNEISSGGWVWNIRYSYEDIDEINVTHWSYLPRLKTVEEIEDEMP